MIALSLQWTNAESFLHPHLHDKLAADATTVTKRSTLAMPLAQWLGSVTRHNTTTAQQRIERLAVADGVRCAGFSILGITGVSGKIVSYPWLLRQGQHLHSVTLQVSGSRLQVHARGCCCTGWRCHRRALGLGLDRKITPLKATPMLGTVSAPPWSQRPSSRAGTLGRGPPSNKLLAIFLLLVAYGSWCGGEWILP